MFGHRHEGRRVKHLDPIIQATPYLMPMRCDAMVFLQHDIEYEPLMRYIADKKRDEGVNVTFLEIIVASFVRAISQVPEVNRFIMNKQYYNRTELTCSMTILMNTPDGSLKENVIKVFFDPSDTIYDVQARLTAKIEANREPEKPSFAIKLASFALSVPGLTSLIAGLVRLLDRYGLLPGVVIDELPFHTSMFITNNAPSGFTACFTTSTISATPPCSWAWARRSAAIRSTPKAPPSAGARCPWASPWTSGYAGARCSPSCSRT
jgi:hypothetical protein